MGMSRPPDRLHTDETETAEVAGETPVTAVEPRGPRARPVTPALAVAGRVDRFLILEKLGEGGMGAVYVAYDTLLDRKVAMKVVRPDRRSSMGGISPRERLLREAQAMARLSHPNVVAVLEVGELDDDVYLALELVEGTTLKAWMRAQRRPWPEVIAHFVAAGRGLAAAHEAGLVHRDFKPDNVLIGSDGRVRVADFGVVSMSHGQRESSSSPSPGVEPDASGASDAFTFSGMRVGTPAYMPPEQYEGEAVDARADQFSFCVALWEALYGERPFPPLAPGASFRDRPMRPLPESTDVPGWLEPLLRRGLSVDPAARWPSMAALIEELARDRGRARRRAMAIAGMVVVVAGTGALAFAGWTRDRGGASPLCRDEARHLAGVWDAARASALTRRFDATGSPAAALSARRVREHLDRWSAAWVSMRTEACAATRIHGDQSEALLDARMRCLDRRLERVGALVTALEESDREGIGRAVEIAADLPALDACSDHEQLTAVAPPPEDPAIHARVTAIEHELARADAIERTGHYAEALAIVTPAVDAATTAGHAPTLAEALALRGRLEVQTGAVAKGVATLREASVLAARAHADDVAADALVEMLWALGDQGKGTDALALLPGAATAVARVHDAELDATMVAHAGGAHAVAGDLESATTELARALELTRAAFGPRHVRVAQVLNRLGNIEAQRGRQDEARRHYEQALTIAEAELGPEHPSAAVTRANLCYLDSIAGRVEEAFACQGRVVAALEAALGAGHPQVAWAANDLGLIEQTRGNLDAARQHFERALVIWEKASGAGHPDVAWPLVNLGELARRRGAPAETEALCRRALRIVESASGPEHPDALHPLACLGGALAESRPADATPLLERALRLAEGLHDPFAIGTVRFALARAALATRTRAPARAHARAAVDALGAAGADGAEGRAEVAGWIQQHRLGD